MALYKLDSFVKKEQYLDYKYYNTSKLEVFSLHFKSHLKYITIS